MELSGSELGNSGSVYDPNKIVFCNILFAISGLVQSLSFTQSTVFLLFYLYCFIYTLNVFVFLPKTVPSLKLK